MRKLTVVCFDIRGTLIKNGEDTYQQMVELVNNLKELSNRNNTDGVLVCTATSDELDQLNDVKEHMDFFYKLLESEGMLGRKIYSDGYIDRKEFNRVNKVKPIIIRDYIDKLNENDDVKEVYFFDDANFNVALFNHIIKDTKKYGVKADNGLTGINGFFEKGDDQKCQKFMH